MKKAFRATTLVLALIASPGYAGKQLSVCKDANGKPYYTDVGCPRDASRQGSVYVPGAQSYSGKESIDTNLLNNYERRVGSGRQWQWQGAPQGGSGH